MSGQINACRYVFPSYKFVYSFICGRHVHVHYDVRCCVLGVTTKQNLSESHQAAHHTKQTATKQNTNAYKKMSLSNANRLKLAALEVFEDDKPLGLANVFACLGMALALHDKSHPGYESFKNLLGIDEQSLRVLTQEPKRVLAMLVSPTAENVLGATEHGRIATAVLDTNKVSRILLEKDLEAQVNDIVRKVWQVDTDLFAPESIVPAPQVPDLVAALVAVENITVSWKEELPIYEEGIFRSPLGPRKAVYCTDGTGETRSMSLLHLDGCRAVRLPCKEDGHARRSMVFVLPTEAYTPLNECIESVAAHIERNDGIRWESESIVDFKFPRFDATLDPVNMAPVLKEIVPAPFTPGDTAFDATLPAAALGGPVYISKVVHGATIKAGRKGAVAKAVTVAPMVVYRSFSGPVVEEFHCDRPFVAILMDEASSGIEFVLKVTGDALDTSPCDE